MILGGVIFRGPSGQAEIKNMKKVKIKSRPSRAWAHHQNPPRPCAIFSKKTQKFSPRPEAQLGTQKCAIAWGQKGTETHSRPANFPDAHTRCVKKKQFKPSGNRKHKITNKKAHARGPRKVDFGPSLKWTKLKKYPHAPTRFRDFSFRRQGVIECFKKISRR